MVATHRAPVIHLHRARLVKTVDALLYTVLIMGAAFDLIVYGLHLADTGHDTLSVVVLLGGLGLEATIVAWVVAGKVP